MLKLILRLLAHKYTSFFVAVLLTITIAYLSLKQPSMEGGFGHVFRGQDKMHHLIAYFVITIAYYFSIQFYFRFKAPLIMATIGAILLGIILEFLQLYSIFGRDFDVIDIVFNFMGVIFAFLTIKKINPITEE